MGHKEVLVTHLRKIMLEELQRRNYSDGTIRRYLHMVEDFARHFGKSPDKLGLEHLRFLSGLPAADAQAVGRQFC